MTRPRVILEFDAHADPCGWRDVPYRVKLLLKRAWRDYGFRAKVYRWTGDGTAPALPPQSRVPRSVNPDGPKAKGEGDAANGRQTGRVKA